jgi:hypothetical protein
MPTTTTTTTTTAAPVGTINTALFSYLTSHTFSTGNQDYAGVFLTFYSNGTFGVVNQSAVSLTDGAPNHDYWISGAVNPGNSYWVRFTQTAVSGAPTAPSTGWIWLFTDQTIYVTNSYFGTTDSTYTIEISTNSSGTNIVATSTGVILSATSYISF